MTFSKIIVYIWPTCQIRLQGVIW